MNKTCGPPKHAEASSVTLSVLTEKDVKDISVMQIVTPLTIDSLGHPVVGGLYDLRLGPSTDKTQPCGSCNKSILMCSGHFGYIELPVPCVNPMFHKIVGTILRYSCLTCHRLQLNEESRKKILSIEPVDEMVQMSIVKLMLDEIKSGKNCIFCKNSLDKIQVSTNRILMTSRSMDKMAATTSKYVNGAQSQTYLREIWTNEEEFLRLIVPVLNEVGTLHPTDCFFFNVIAVPPPNVRPVNYVNGRVVENPQTTVYKNILTNALVMNHLIKVVQKKGDVNVLHSQEALDFYEAARGKTSVEKLNNAWEELQGDVNGLLSKDVRRSRDGLGLKQIIEKKEGIIRKHMMGKRVNYAARSVITPDPNLDISEVGVPEVFAKKLTCPVAVTPWNVEFLRGLVKNGPDVYPGANLVEMEDGSVQRINPHKQESLLKILLTPHNSRRKGFQGVKIVHKHLQNGDVLLLNRQPTLHKPSIMAHRARILKGEKTLRLHYANCKAYNADFDGDEMNAHFPQDEVARSEGYNIAEVAQQYLVPKDGTPLSGLIQDHMISGVRLSLRGRFFNRNDYLHLVYQGLSHQTDKIQLLAPAILKPLPLWSGKQILSTVIINIIPKGRKLINLNATSKISAKDWQKHKERKWKAGGTRFKDPIYMTEAEVIIRNGELLSGILDKTHYGATPFGLIHCIYELYGGHTAIRLLSSLGKLFTRFLQQEGFTLGVHDILTIAEADVERRKIIKESRAIGKEAIANALEIPASGMTEQEMALKIEERCSVDAKFRQIIDRSYKTSLDSYTNAINKCCLPAGLVCKFPENNLQLMVQSGAKGSTVNTMQISCLLGQIELEGKRPPVMISGKSLPSFPSFEFTPRAGGFIDGRFMTGIQPQEFFFHCMAGREGLIDTAVKTSRSGYLQRCLIKHLEGLKVNYDLTVRNSDQKVIQFMYGEDGMDIFKAQFFNDKQMKFLQDNAGCIVQEDVLKLVKDDEDQAVLQEYQKNLDGWIVKNGLGRRMPSPFTYFASELRRQSSKDIKQKKVEKLWRSTDDEFKKSLKKQLTCPDPVVSVFQPDHHFGAINEHLQSMLSKYTANQKKKHRRQFEDMFKLKSMQSMCAPGEPVGLLAAQSVGEPSTQMTLNTFHFAGRGEMNVTLGIPRLREILMMASRNIKTPCMEIPFKSGIDLQQKAAELRKILTRVVVGDVLEKIDVSVKLELVPARRHHYGLRFKFLPKECYADEFMVSIKSILRHMKKQFFKEMFIAIAKVSKVKSNLVTMEQPTRAPVSRDSDDDEPSKTTAKPEEDSSDDEVEDQEDAKLNFKHQDKQEDQEPADEEEKMDVQSDEETDEEVTAQASDESVVDNYSFANSYREDKSNNWCELTFSLPISYKKLDLTAVLREVASKSVIWETPNIKRAITYVQDEQLMLRTDGINVGEMCKYHDLLDLNRLYCNDIHKIAETYGIEAASRIIVKEVKDVFKVYGIKVDSRHLSLIADYMTSNGSFEPLSRRGMESSASPLQQMSFESSLQFLKAATARARKDDLVNPSSSLMLGKPCYTGTGSFSLIQKLPSLEV